MIHALLRLILADGREQVFVSDQPGKAITTEDNEVSNLQRLHEDINLYIRLGSQTARNHVALGMGTRLFLCQQARAHLLCNPGMILRDLPNLSVMDIIGTAITNVRNVGSATA